MLQLDDNFIPLICFTKHIISKINKQTLRHSACSVQLLREIQLSNLSDPNRPVFFNPESGQFLI